MQIPSIQGEFCQKDFFIYSAADENYFNQYAKFLINSSKRHLNIPIHMHLYNPSSDSLNWCYNNEISVTWEYFDLGILDQTFNKWSLEPKTDEDLRKKNCMVKDHNDLTRLKNEIIKTYYACTRFIRLSEILEKPSYVIMLDTDSIIRKSFLLPSNNVDIHIFEKKHKKHVPYTQHLASTIFYTGTLGSLQLIRDHANLILNVYNNDALYWFLDQETLDVAIQKYKKSALNLDLVDFNMNNNSPIWCAKGPRKYNSLYIDEIKKYS